MEIYLLVGVIYAFFNRSPDNGVTGFMLDILFWPFDILKNVSTGWNRAKGKDELVAKANINLCHQSIEEFHNVVADTILEETGKGLAAQPEHIRTGMIIYEIQAALAAAKRFRLGDQYHRDFAAASLARGGIPPEIALGMVDTTLSNSTEIDERVWETLDGATGYAELTLGTGSLSKHVKDTLSRLQSMPQAEYSIT